MAKYFAKVRYSAAAFQEAISTETMTAAIKSASAKAAKYSAPNKK